MRALCQSQSNTPPSLDPSRARRKYPRTLDYSQRVLSTIRSVRRQVRMVRLRRQLGQFDILAYPAREVLLHVGDLGDLVLGNLHPGRLEISQESELGWCQEQQCFGRWRMRRIHRRRCNNVLGGGG